MYEGLKINFSLWHIVGGIYGYNKLIRLPRKQKKALKKSLLQDIFTVDRNYLKECPKPKKCQYLVINQIDMKKIVGKIYVYKVLPPFKNWYSIMTDDGLNRSNIIIVGKKQLLKVALALIVMVLFNKRTTINKFKTK